MLFVYPATAKKAVESGTSKSFLNLKSLFADSKTIIICQREEFEKGPEKVKRAEYDIKGERPQSPLGKKGQGSHQSVRTSTIP